MSQWDDNQDPWNAPYNGDGGGPAAPTTATAQPRFNTTPAWGDPLHAPNPSDPYYAEWRAANPGIPESAAEPIGNQVDVYGNPYGGRLNDPTTPNPGTTPTPTPTPAPGPSTGGGSLIAPFGDPAPVYNPTPVGTAPTFRQPTIEEAMADPGYKFVLDQGNKNLESWLSSRGTANDSSAAKAFIDYGQGAAGTQYGNVWNRAYGAYNADMGAFNANAANMTHTNDTTWQNNWNTWLQNWNIFRDQRDSTFNHQLAVS